MYIIFRVVSWPFTGAARSDPPEDKPDRRLPRRIRERRKVLGELVYSGLERLVNSTLRTDPDTLEALAVLSGKVLLLEFAGTDIRIYICPAEEGLELKPEQPGGAN